MPRIDAFLQIGREQGGSDIHFTVGLPPLVRLDGELAPIKYRELSHEEAEDILSEILSDSQHEQFRKTGAVDLSYESTAVGRFRINVCRHNRGIGASCRVIPDKVPQLGELGLPAVVSRFTAFRSGLVLVTGA